jgi:hypothetical protein
MYLKTFNPLGSAPASGAPTAQQNVAVTTGVQQVNLPSPAVFDNQTVRLVVDGSANIAWCCGNNSSLTMNNGVHMLANTVETFSVPVGTTQLSVIGAAAGSTFRVFVGDGQ